MDHEERRKWFAANFSDLTAHFPVCLPPTVELVDQPRLIYLDQWCWRSLGLARVGKENRAGLSRSDYQVVRERVWKRELCLPLSQVHHRETGGFRSPAKRAESVAAMAELSGFAVFDMSDLDHWEAHVGVADLLGLASPPHPRVLNWGLLEAYPESSALTAALRPGGITVQEFEELPRSPWSDKADPMRLRSPDWVLDQFALLCDIEPSSPSQFVDNEYKRQNLRANLPSEARRLHDDLVHVHTLKNLAGHIGLACMLLGGDDAELNSQLGTSPGVLLNRLPITRVFQGLLDEAHRPNNRNWSKNASDEFDFFFLAAAGCLFDTVVCDGPTAGLAGRLPKEWFVAEVATDLRKALLPA